MKDRKNNFIADLLNKVSNTSVHNTPVKKEGCLLGSDEYKLENDGRNRRFRRGNDTAVYHTDKSNIMMHILDTVKLDSTNR